MQPNDDNEQWRQPRTQASDTPFAPNVEENKHTPIVSMTPDATEQPEPWEAEDPQGETIQQPPVQSPSDDAVHWEAAEYINRHKSPLWYISFVLITLIAIAGAVYFSEYIFALLVAVMAAALFVYTRRPPRIFSYTLTARGLYVNDRLYSFAEFKSFGVIHDENEYSIMLIPTKRFHMGVSVYFPEESGEAIVDILGARLPMENLRLDLVDQIIRKLRI